METLTLPRQHTKETLSEVKKETDSPEDQVAEGTLPPSAIFPTLFSLPSFP